MKTIICSKNTNDDVPHRLLPRLATCIHGKQQIACETGLHTKRLKGFSITSRPHIWKYIRRMMIVLK